MQNGKRPIYEKPEEFFALTFPTHNLRNLVRDVVLRLAGQERQGGAPARTDLRRRQDAHADHHAALWSTIRRTCRTCRPCGSSSRPSARRRRKARVAALCFDKLDVETGMEVRGPDGSVRRLKQPWSVLAYQIAGDDGLKLLHAEGKAEERNTPPAENTLTDLLSLPLKEGLGTLILIDEVLLYAKVQDPLRSRLAGHPDLVLPVPDPGGGQGRSVLHRGVAAVQRAQGPGRQPGQEDRFGPVRHLPASARGGRSTGGEGRRGRGAATPAVQPQVRQ